MKKAILSIFAVGALMHTAYAQNVNIPDANFKAYLVGNAAINTNGDTEIQTTEASTFSGVILCPNLSISDLTGIEAFTSLDKLYCYSNQLTSLDVSQNTALTYLSCGSNQLTNIDVSQNTALTSLYCTSNQLTSIDISLNTALTVFYCSSNQLTGIDISNNTALTELDLSDNQLASLDVSQNSDLLYLYLGNNQLTSFDISQNTSLEELNCTNSLLTSLNVANGNNNNMSFVFAQDNINLTCIKHDIGFDPSANPTNWQKDPSANWNDTCSGVGLYDINLDEQITVFPNPVQDELFFGDEVQDVAVYDLSGKSIKSYSFIEANSIDVSDLNSGVYFLQINNGRGIIVKKISKE